MTWYPRVLDGIKAAVPFLNVSRAINLALLVSAILDRRTFNLSELAGAYPTAAIQALPKGVRPVILGDRGEATLGSQSC